MCKIDPIATDPSLISSENQRPCGETGRDRREIGFKKCEKHAYSDP